MSLYDICRGVREAFTVDFPYSHANHKRVRGFLMRYVAAASAVALGLGLAGTAQAQTPVQPEKPAGVVPAETPAPAAEATPGDRPAAPLADAAAAPDEE